MIDVHCHLNFHAFEKDYDECIKEANQKGVSKIINTGTKLDSSKKAVELAQKYPNLYAIVGVHPHHADKLKLNQEARIVNQGGEDSDGQNPDSWIEELEKLARMPKVVGIGEIGMDYYRYQSNGIVDKRLQKEIFEAQIELAHRLNLPIQIHNRHAGQDIIAILKHHTNLLKRDNPGMFHCFAGNMEVLKAALELGFCIGFDGNSTYPGLAPGETVELKDSIQFTPIDRIVTETDSPFLTPVPYRGSRNKPAYVIIVGEFIASVKGIPCGEVDYQTEQNAQRIFHL